MLDLDHLANQQALTVNELPEKWREAMWSAEFQKISQSMSDGEVEEFINLCPSVGHLKALVFYLQAKHDATGTAPFTLLKQEASSAGLNPEEWIKKNFKPGP